VIFMTAMVIFLSWFFADGSAPSTSAATDPLGWLVNIGVAGIVIILLVTGQLRTKSEVMHLLDEIAAKDKAIDAIQNQIMSQALPALANSTRVIEAVPNTEQALIEQLRKAQEDAKALVAAMERATGQER
jgi:hypothetical protein